MLPRLLVSLRLQRAVVVREQRQPRRRHTYSNCKSSLSCFYSSASNSPTVVRIGHVQREIAIPSDNDAHLIPFGYLAGFSLSKQQHLFRHLQWLLQKDNLGQDVMLVGSPGAGAVVRRRLVLAYAELVQRPVEFLTLTADTTESDLKQRRELIRGTGRREPFFSTNHDHQQQHKHSQQHLQVRLDDQAPVRAALHGRLLILDGLQNAERNVLPTLNNLLENREMHLEDGRLLVSPKRHRTLSSSSSLSSSFLVPTHEDFRVVALTSYSGSNTLDPPVRSRFQIRRVDSLLESEQLFETLLLEERGVDYGNENNNSNNENNNNHTVGHYYPSASAPVTAAPCALNETTAKKVTLFTSAMEAAALESSSSSVARVAHFPVTAAAAVARVWQTFPNEPRRSIMARAYPFGIEEERLASLVRQQQHYKCSQQAFARTCDELNIESSAAKAKTTQTAYHVTAVEAIHGDPFHVKVQFQPLHSQSLWDISSRADTITVTVPSGGNRIHPTKGSALKDFLRTLGSNSVLSSMMQEHYAGRDILLVSPKGQGKSATAKEFAKCLGYDVYMLNLYKEMTAHDLLMRRTTLTTGETGWAESPLLQAARTGQICILDGIEKIARDTLGSLQRLLTDREVSLPNGTKLVHQLSQQQQQKEKCAQQQQHAAVGTIHPSFRVIALSSISNKSLLAWITEVPSMFSTIALPTPERSCLNEILSPSNTYSDSEFEQLLDFNERLTPDAATECGVSPLSTRTLLRLIQRARVGVSLYDSVCSALLADLLPPTPQRATLETLLHKSGIRRRSSSRRQNNSDIGHSAVDSDMLQVRIEGDKLAIGDLTLDRKKVKNAELVPSPYFFDIPAHVQIIRTLVGEWAVGERSFLLLGNQGTGKNKICDRICELANFEREYIQLHRDSTIGQLTLSPSLEDGNIVWHDSPLVRAVADGRVLVIDEADKAPLEVVSVLKSLIEDGELLLGDGRRVLRHVSEHDSGTIPIHKDFTVFVLANRPGRLFHGNDFFQEIGDCFSTHVIPNPDIESEIKLLQSYAPNVDLSTLRSITASFAELRKMFEHGDSSYPYSTREAVSVARHLEKYPQDDIVTVLHNVLDLDSFDARLYGQLCEVFRVHGIPFQEYDAWRRAVARSVKDSDDLRIEYTTDRTVEGESNPPPLSFPKRGKWDENNDPHVGGNQWAGGTGGSDTAGLGGRGGPYRLDRGHKVHQVSDEAKAQVSQEVQVAARKIAKKALQDKLQEIGMSETEFASYTRFLDPIKCHIANLRTVLQSVESKTPNRGWIKRQVYGEIDDSKLIEGVAGEKTIYKRRGYVEPTTNEFARRPKRLRFVVDCSGSMYRFNGYDDRLNRCLQATALVMESFDGMQTRFDYSIVGHSGDSRCIKLVDFGDPPSNAKERMRVLQTIVAHSQFCQSGDNTLGSIKQAIVDVAHDQYYSDDESGDGTGEDSIVIAVSDANLERYGISPRELGRAIATPSESRVKAYCIFIASFGSEAEAIKRELPLGRGFVCMQTSYLPTIVRDILASEIV